MPCKAERRDARPQPRAFAGQDRVSQNGHGPHTVRRRATELGLSLGEMRRCSTRYCGPNARCSIGKKAATTNSAENKKAGRRAVRANQKYGGRRCRGGGCAEDTKGQTCASAPSLHWKTKEGLVRMCACRGTAGVAHVWAWRSRRRFWSRRPRRTI